MSAQFMLTTSLLFLGSVVAVPIATRLGLGSVLGYLLAGIALGPVLRLVHADVVGLQHFVEFGVVMMLFLIGLEMSPKSLWEMRSRIFALGGLQVLLTTLLVTQAAIMLGQPWRVSLALGLILALSSTAIVSQTLNEKQLLQSDGGQASFAVLLFQDIAVIPMLVLLPLLALSGSGVAGGASDHGAADHGADQDHAGLELSLVEGLSSGQTALMSVLVISIVLFAGHYLTDPIFRFVARARLHELFVSTALMFVLGIALLMTLVGLSPALGTFLAGVVMSRSEYKHQLESDINPFKGIFLGVFFITVGAGIDFQLLAESVSTVLGLTAGLIALKIAVLWVLARVFRVRGGGQWLVALGLAQAGEFGFVLLSFSVSNAVVPQDVAALVLLVVALSMLVTPLLFMAYDRLIAPRFAARTSTAPDGKIDGTAKVIVAGHGRFGGIVNRALAGAGFDTTVVDYSLDQLEMIRKFGLKAHYGDATRPDLLMAAGITRAKVLVIAIDNKESTNHLAHYVLKNHPHVHVVARAVDRMHVYDLWSLGCRDIIREMYDGSLRAARSAFEALGFDREEASRMIASFEAVDRKMMVELADLYDTEIPAAENAAFMERFHLMRDEWEAELKGSMRSASGR